MTNALPIGGLPGAGISGAIRAYQSVDGGAVGNSGGSQDFSALLSRAVEGAIATGNQADAQAAQAISGHGDLTSVVTAVSRAQLALQTTVAIRDRVIQAYQDIIKMPI
jgi:flagellar hook-basal body complex protein FliE